MSDVIVLFQTLFYASFHQRNPYILCIHKVDETGSFAVHNMQYHAIFDNKVAGVFYFHLEILSLTDGKKASLMYT